jgi:hypothetical protein
LYVVTNSVHSIIIANSINGMQASNNINGMQTCIEGANAVWQRTWVRNIERLTILYSVLLAHEAQKDAVANDEDNDEQRALQLRVKETERGGRGEDLTNDEGTAKGESVVDSVGTMNGEAQRTTRTMAVQWSLQHPFYAAALRLEASQATVYTYSAYDALRCRCDGDGGSLSSN